MAKKQVSSRKLLLVLAHPDDESLGTGGIAARYSSEGVEVELICATRGERGRYFDQPSPGMDTVGRTRTQELLCASEILGIQQVHFLDYIDGDLEEANPMEISSKIVAIMETFRPDVVVTFSPDGAYGHPDHIAISQFTLAAIARLENNNFLKKCYFIAWGQSHWDIYNRAFKELSMTVKNVVRKANPWPEWALNARVNCEGNWNQVWNAIQCHKTQLPGYAGLSTLTESEHRVLWGNQLFYRVFSLVDKQAQEEIDLFEGIRSEQIQEQ